MNEMTSAEFLRDKLQEARARNPQFSLRSFAKKIGLSPGIFSQLLSRKKRLSYGRAHAISSLLGLQDREREAFLLQVQVEGTKDPELRHDLLEKLRKVRGKRGNDSYSLGVDHFRLISEWYGLATLEILSAFGSSWDAASISKSLDVPKLEIDATLERLVRLGLIRRERNGKYLRVEGRVLVESESANEGIRNYYRGVHAKSLDSVNTVTPDRKVIGTEVFAFDQDQIEEARRRTDEFLDGLVELSKKGKSRSVLYQALVNFFPVSRDPKQKGKSK